MSVNLRFEIQSAEPIVRRFVDKTGKEREFREQEALVWVASRGSSEFQPKPCKVPLEDRDPYPVGLYTIHPRSFFIDYKHFGRLALVPRLVPFVFDALESRYSPDGFSIDLES